MGGTVHTALSTSFGLPSPPLTPASSPTGPLACILDAKPINICLRKRALPECTTIEAKRPRLLRPGSKPVPFPFLSLPPELRLSVYEMALATDKPIPLHSPTLTRPNEPDTDANGSEKQMALVRVSRQIRNESIEFVCKNRFVLDAIIAAWKLPNFFSTLPFNEPWRSLAPASFDVATSKTSFFSAWILRAKHLEVRLSSEGYLSGHFVATNHGLEIFKTLVNLLKGLPSLETLKISVEEPVRKARYPMSKQESLREGYLAAVGSLFEALGQLRGLKQVEVTCWDEMERQMWGLNKQGKRGMIERMRSKWTIAV